MGNTVNFAAFSSFNDIDTGLSNESSALGKSDSTVSNPPP